ncbi:asparagine synthase-related protein [Pseudoalteromonas sp. SG45-1]|uniref:asparagine synthase-related protein n=1 Tax=Pseudoalteromonas sp. SG45-1 TaxID=2760957 RepID=UPI0016013AF4|nr:asparagine synthase-related protein [Pseudoalteromonas sp. SG45-1]MBB1400967.1 hypothetical protein [Pseudoalteromonas sp. SG45-1]
MINKHTSSEPDFSLKADLAGEFPIYLFLSDDKKVLLYSESVNALFNDGQVKKNINISNCGISFLLQSGVIPPPRTAYKNIFILGIGDRVRVTSVNGTINLDFDHDFPFINANRSTEQDMLPNEDLILEMLAEATIKRINTSKPTFLFHSAGKDSNSIALALAEAGWQNRVTLITHKSKGEVDESDVSAGIAKKLGFKHRILYEIDRLENTHKAALEEYFSNSPFPCTDNVALAYPLYAHQLPELRDSNIIDGGGNDSHMMTPPSKRELDIFLLSKFLHHASFLRSFVKSESLLSALLKTPAERCGVTGLSYSDTKKVFSASNNVYPYWKGKSKLNKNRDMIDFRTSVLTPILASELHIRKARNFADSINSNLILPFANQQVARYFSNMPEKFLFDRKTSKNKLVLREMLKKRVGLDSDALGKLGFSYDSQTPLLNNWDWFLAEITRCSLWECENLLTLIERLKANMLKNNKYSVFSGRLIYQIYLLSAWYNRNKYLNS